MGAQLGYDEHMAEFKGVPVTIEPPRSGEKYRTAQGFTAIKDGLRARGGPEPVARTGKPHWLKAPLAAGAGYDAVRRTVREHRLATVCEEAKCPNIRECWNAGTATLMVLGAVCTRSCPCGAFDTDNPRGWLHSPYPAHCVASAA